MLKNVKSEFYFSKKLFSLFDEGQKLRLIKYSKNLQKNLKISLINYIFFSKRYIIYESKGKGKEYKSDNDKLLYEGEFLNGERNGKGKEYLKGELVFEGEI